MHKLGRVGVHIMCLPSSSSSSSQVERFGKPTWKRLVEAVEDHVGGNNRALAQTMAAEHPGVCVCECVCVCVCVHVHVCMHEREREREN